MNILKKDGLLNSILKADSHFGLLLLAVFIFNAHWILDSLAIYIFAKPVSLIIHTAFLLIAVLTAIIVFLTYLVKNGHEKAKSTVSVLFSIAVMVLFVSVSSILLSLWSDTFIPLMMKPGRINDLWGAGSYLLLAFSINCIFLFSAKTCCVYILQGMKLSQFGKATINSLKNTLKHFHVFMIYSLVLFVLLIFYYMINNALLSILSSILPAIFLSKFVLYLLITFLRALITMIVLNMCVRMNRNAEDELLNHELPEIDNMQAKKEVFEKKRIPVFAVSIFLISIIAGIISLPGSIKGTNTLLSDIEYRMILADNMIQEDETRQAVAEFAKAEADLDSLQKYLKKILKSKGENIDVPQYGISSKHIYSNCAYDDYFNVLLTIDRNKDEYNRGKLASYVNTIPESAIWAYGYYKEKGMKEQALKMFNSVVMQGVFTDRFITAKNYSRSGLYKLLERAEQLQTELNNRKLYQYMERAKYENRKALIKEINNFILTNGGDADLYAYAATLTEETAQDESDYDYMREYALKYYELVEAENHQELVASIEFTAYMLYRSLHNEDAVAFSRERYQEYPGDVDIALIYANALMENRTHKESNEILLSLKEESIYKDYLMAMNHLELGEYAKSLECADKLEKALVTYKDDADTLSQLDFYLYGYILECISYFERDNDSSDSEDFGKKAGSFLNVVEKHKTDSLSYYNIIGLKNWFTQKYEEANKLFECAMDKYPRLSYPYLMIGVNYLEKKEVEYIDCSSLAEKYLLEYIQRQPESEEAYFCLGHIYKHTNDNDRAKRAFNKVLEILPYANNDYDEWGISHHTLLTNMGLDGEN